MTAARPPVGNTPRTVLISGGSRGLGLEFVDQRLRRGDVVATFARKATEAMEERRRQFPDRFRFIECDAQDLDGLGGFVRDLVREFGGIFALVNNAAIGQDHLLPHAAPDALRSIMAINFEAPVLLTRLVVRQMLLQSSGGRIVNISSICGSRGYPGLTVYSATKGALDAFTRSLAREVGDRGILVNAIAPGFFESEMSAILLPSQLETIRRRTPTGRLTDARHVAKMLDLLLSEDTNITGQVIFVDGGIGS